MKSILKKITNWQSIFGICLILTSIIIYILHYLIFHDMHHILIYSVHDLAFVPIEVLLVTLILHKMLNTREHKEKLYKLNMVIGAFFSEVGTELINHISGFDPFKENLRKRAVLNNTWTEKEFRNTVTYLKNHEFKIEISKKDIIQLRNIMEKKRTFLLDLLANPNILEHDEFTDLLWAVFHLAEELMLRKKLGSSTEEDLEHLSGDIKRVYCLLVKEWLTYMKHLKQVYPYLFSLAVRTNPFDPNAKVEL